MTFNIFKAWLIANQRLPQIVITLALLLLISSCGGSSTSSGGIGDQADSFSKLLGPTFDHPRCQNCHAFEAENATKVQHRELGQLDQDCGECHFTPGWEAPFQSFSFSNLSSTQICEAIKNKTGNDVQRLKESITNSSLAQWAIEDGGTISGTLATAPPGNMTEMTKLIDQWILAGASCN
ncbi:MAG: hypothetical protein ACI9WC_001792 [Arenicella sp.]|jgi:hypothetical protein